MNTENILYDELLSAFQMKKTGKLFVYCKGLKGATLKHGEISIRSGQIVAVQFGEQHDSIAFATLVSLEIHRTLFMDAAAVNGSPKAQTPLMAKVLERLGGGRPVKAKDKTDALSDKVEALVEDAKQVLAIIYGDQAGEKVDALSAKYPPEHEPIQFLHHCQKEATSSLGLEVARELFNPVFAKARAS